MRPESLAHDRIVDEFAQNRERPFVCELFRVGDGVAHTKTHPKMFR